MKVTYTEEAVADIVQAISYLNERKPTAAAKLDVDIARCLERLADRAFLKVPPEAATDFAVNAAENSDGSAIRPQTSEFAGVRANARIPALDHRHQIDDRFFHNMAFELDCHHISSAGASSQKTRSHRAPLLPSHGRLLRASPFSPRGS